MSEFGEHFKALSARCGFPCSKYNKEIDEAVMLQWLPCASYPYHVTEGLGDVFEGFFRKRVNLAILSISRNSLC